MFEFESRWEFKDQLDLSQNYSFDILFTSLADETHSKKYTKLQVYQATENGPAQLGGIYNETEYQEFYSSDYGWLNPAAKEIIIIDMFDGLVPHYNEFSAWITANAKIIPEWERLFSKNVDLKYVNGYPINDVEFESLDNIVEKYIKQRMFSLNPATKITYTEPNLSWQAVPDAESYEISVDNSFNLSSTSPSIDLSTATRWPYLPSGEHSIVITSSGQYFEDSKSEEVIITKLADPITTAIGCQGISSGNLVYTAASTDLPDPQRVAEGEFTKLTSQLDSVFPYSEIQEVTDAKNNVFIKIPKMWIKITSDTAGAVDSFLVSKIQEDADFFIPDCFLDPKDVTCNTYLDYILIGKYESSLGSDNKLYSKSNATKCQNITIDALRQHARNQGLVQNQYDGYQLYDYSMWTLVNLLSALYIKSMDTGSLVQSTYSTPITGDTDGCPALFCWKPDGAIKLLGIEYQAGGFGKYVDGVWINNMHPWITRLPQNYTTSTDLSNYIELALTGPEVDGLVHTLQQGSGDYRSYVYPLQVNAHEPSNCDSTYYYNLGGTYVFVSAACPYMSGPSKNKLWTSVVSKSPDAGQLVSKCTGRLAQRPLYSQGLSYGKMYLGAFDQANNEFQLGVNGIGTCTDSELAIPEAYISEDGTITAVAGVEILNSSVKKIITPKAAKQFKFTNSSELTEIVISGADSIISHALQNCPKLTDVFIPKTVKEFQGNAFYDSRQVTNLYLEDLAAYCQINVSESNGSGAHPFEESLGILHHIYVKDQPITTLTIPNGTTILGSYLFANTGLQEVICNPELTKIGYNTFAYNSQLQKVTFGENLTEISNNAFNNQSIKVYNCVKCKQIPQITNSSITVASDCKIEVPAAQVEAYKTAAGWSAFAANIVGI